MTEREPAKSATTGGLTIAPSLDLVTQAAQVPRQTSVVDQRVLVVCGLAILLGVAASGVGQLLEALITLITNIAYFGEVSLAHRTPAEAIPRLGLWSIPVPVVGALIIGVMARFGSKAIRGHGIPEAIEQILTNESRIPARMTLLKPLSAAIAIGTGGPFGAEGPIIATGGALGSMFGQILRTTVAERKTLLAAGAASGMAAIFGSPVSAVLLAIELLLFEFRPRSMIPVALAASTAAGLRMMIKGMEPVFVMSNLEQPSEMAQATYIVLGALMGLVSVAVTRILYLIEDRFEKLPIHWMWWPALGAIVVGVVGYFEPRTLGVGYNNISDILSNKLTLAAIVSLCSLKFVSWSISLGSGTSGGTLAPLFTIGGGIGAALGIVLADALPVLGIDPRIAALVGMASIFAGAARAMLASAVFAFETTQQPFGLLPLLGGCASAQLISSILMRNSIMTEKISRRGIRTPEEFVADSLDQVLVRDVATRPVITVNADDSIGQMRNWLSSGMKSSHQGFPVVNGKGALVGIVTRRDVSDPALTDSQVISDAIRGPVRFVYDDCTVRQAADHMVNHLIGRLPVMTRTRPIQLVGIITRSDVLSVFQHRIRESEVQQPTMSLFGSNGKRPPGPPQKTPSVDAPK